MEAMLLTPIGIISFGLILSLALITMVKLKRRREFVEARLNRGLRQYVGTEERADVAVLFASPLSEPDRQPLEPAQAA